MDAAQSERLAQQFLAALSTSTAAAYEQVLAEDAGLRLWRWDGAYSYRPRQRVIHSLTSEWSAWPDPSLTSFSILPGQERAAIEYRIQATEGDRYVEHNRSAFLTVDGDKISTLDIYCAEPVPSAHRRSYIAPATLSEPEVHALLRDFQYTTDSREVIGANVDRSVSKGILLEEEGDPHPGSNAIFWANWPAAEADRHIEEMIEEHRRRNIGFWWFTGQYDSPPDLGERLRAHGCVWAGDNLTVVRLGLDNPQIPYNPDVDVVLLNERTEEDAEAALQVCGAGFHWSKEQTDARRASWFEQLKGPWAKDHMVYLAKLDDKPVAFGHTVLKTGVAFLAGAGTLPAYRNRKIYSTLLRQRLIDAAACGYQVAVVYAGPMSRRVLVRYEFKAYNKFDIYAWMPVIDMNVIKSLVVDE